MPPRATAKPRVAKPKLEPVEVPAEALPPELEEEAAPEIIVIESGTAEPDAETVPVFTLKGVTHSMSAQVKSKKALKFVYVIEQKGVMLGGIEMIKDLLGEPALMVLLDDDDVTDDHIMRVINLLMKNAFGELFEQGKG